MAPKNLQEVIEALRLKYGPSDASIKLSELLFFMGSLQSPPGTPRHASQGQPQQSPKGQGLEASKHAPRVHDNHKPQAQTLPQAKPPPATVNHRGTRASTAPHSAPGLGEKPTNQENPGQCPGLLAPLGRLGNLANTQRPRTFAEVAKDPKGQGTLLGKPTKPSKPSYIPERLSNPRNTPQPIRAYFEGQDPLGQTC